MAAPRRYEVSRHPEGHFQWERKTKNGNVPDKSTKKHGTFQEAYIEAERDGVQSGGDFVVLSEGCDQPWP